MISDQQSSTKQEDICLSSSLPEFIIGLSLEGSVSKLRISDLKDCTQISSLPLSGVNYTHIIHIPSIDMYAVHSHEDAANINRLHLLDSKGNQISYIKVDHGKGYSKSLALIDNYYVAVASHSNVLSVFSPSNRKITLKETIQIHCKDICGITNISPSELLVYGDNCLQIIKARYNG